MALCIDLGKHRIMMTKYRQIAVGRPMTRKDGKLGVAGGHYFNTMEQAMQYLVRTMALENEIHSVEELAKYDKEAMDMIEVWAMTLPLPKLEASND